MTYGMYSKKGYRGSGLRLHHSEYEKYIYQGKDIFVKKKVYVSAYDANIEYQEITKGTFRKAQKRASKELAVIEVDDVKDLPLGVRINYMEQ